MKQSDDIFTRPLTPQPFTLQPPPAPPAPDHTDTLLICGTIILVALLAAWCLMRNPKTR